MDEDHALNDLVGFSERRIEQQEIDQHINRIVGQSNGIDMSNFERMGDLDGDSRIAAQLQVEEMAIAQMQ